MYCVPLYHGGGSTVSRCLCSARSERKSFKVALPKDQVYHVLLLELEYLRTITWFTWQEVISVSTCFCFYTVLCMHTAEKMCLCPSPTKSCKPEGKPWAAVPAVYCPECPASWHEPHKYTVTTGEQWRPGRGRGVSDGEERQGASARWHRLLPDVPGGQRQIHQRR